VKPEFGSENLGKRKTRRWTTSRSCHRPRHPGDTATRSVPFRALPRQKEFMFECREFGSFSSRTFSFVTDGKPQQQGLKIKRGLQILDNVPSSNRLFLISVKCSVQRNRAVRQED
jgi:hypothetical protein